MNECRKVCLNARRRFQCPRTKLEYGELHQLHKIARKDSKLLLRRVKSCISSRSAGKLTLAHGIAHTRQLWHHSLKILATTFPAFKSTPMKISDEEVLEAAKNIIVIMAPGFGGLPNIGTYHIASRDRTVSTACLIEGIFPVQWKKHKLILPGSEINDRCGQFGEKSGVIGC